MSDAWTIPLERVNRLLRQQGVIGEVDDKGHVVPRLTVTASRTVALCCHPLGGLHFCAVTSETSPVVDLGPAGPERFAEVARAVLRLAQEPTGQSEMAGVTR